MRNSVSINILFLLVTVVYSQVYTGTTSEFSIDDTSYSYSAKIPVNLKCDDVSIKLFDPKTIRQVSYFVDSVHFTSIDSFSQIVEIYFSKWFYKGISRYKRVLCPGESLTIDLLKFEHNIPSIPQLKKATIRYYFDSNEQGCTVCYNQRIIVNRKIRFVYRKMVALQLNNFTRTLENSIRK
ncbi:MAG TPA: hypothetical protein VHO70_02375 [Chitinispirillaceae bacterium]|nr:hypothetical protein [Chitinispirillaceae bacterium]